MSALKCSVEVLQFYEIIYIFFQHTEWLVELRDF